MSDCATSGIQKRCASDEAKLRVLEGRARTAACLRRSLLQSQSRRVTNQVMTEGAPTCPVLHERHRLYKGQEARGLLYRSPRPEYETVSSSAMSSAPLWRGRRRKLSSQPTPQRILAASHPSPRCAAIRSPGWTLMGLEPNMRYGDPWLEEDSEGRRGRRPSLRASGA